MLHAQIHQNHVLISSLDVLVNWTIPNDEDKKNRKGNTKVSDLELFCDLSLYMY